MGGLPNLYNMYLKHEEYIPVPASYSLLRIRSQSPGNNVGTIHHAVSKRLEAKQLVFGLSIESTYK
jgi:hypothetical protein